MPRQARPEWLREWDAEVVAALRKAVPDGDRARFPTRARLTVRIAGSLLDALTLRFASAVRAAPLRSVVQAGKGVLACPGPSLLGVALTGSSLATTVVVLSFARASVFRPLPYAEPGRLVRIWESSGGGPPVNGSASLQNFRDWEAGAGAGTFDGMALLGSRSANLAGAGEAVNLRAGVASCDLFRLLDVRAAAPGSLDLCDARGEPLPVAILSAAAWRRLFGGDPGAVGSTISVNGEPYTVGGILPATFVPPVGRAEVWVPLGFDDERPSRSLRAFDVIGRLAPGTGVERARAEVSAIGRRLAERFPEANRGWSVRMAPLAEVWLGRGTRRAAWLAMAAAGGLLLVAATLLAAIRRSAAATPRRGRCRPPRLGECVLVSLGGAALAWPIARQALGALAGLLAVADAPVGLDLTLDGSIALPVLGVAAALGGLSDLAAGRSGWGRASGSPGRRLVPGGFVAATVAIAAVLLVMVGLLSRSAVRLHRGLRAGFEPAGVWSVAIPLLDRRYRDAGIRVGFLERLAAEVARQPGVQSAAVATLLPSGPSRRSLRVGVEVPGGGWRRTESELLLQSVGPGFFETLAIAVPAGRAFDRRDSSGAAPVTMVSAAAVAMLWPGGDAVGRSLDVLGARTVVGVAGDVQYGPDREPVVYLPFSQYPDRVTHLLVRLDGSPTAGATNLGSLVRSLDPIQPVGPERALDDVLEDATATYRALVFALAWMAYLAAVLAGAGVYVWAPTRGASAPGRRDRLRRLAPIALGVALGLPVAVGVSAALKDLLFEARLFDPVIFGAVAAGLLLGGWIALAASRTHPP